MDGKWKKRNEQNVSLGEFSKRNGMPHLPVIYSTKFCPFNLESEGKHATSFRESSLLTFIKQPNQQFRRIFPFHYYSFPRASNCASNRIHSTISIHNLKHSHDLNQSLGYFLKNTQPRHDEINSHVSCPQNFIPKSSQTHLASRQDNDHRYKTHKTKAPIALTRDQDHMLHGKSYQNTTTNPFSTFIHAFHTFHSQKQAQTIANPSNYFDHKATLQAMTIPQKPRKTH